MLEPTNANRALVNRGIAEAMGQYVEGISPHSGAVNIRVKPDNPMRGHLLLDYTRDLNACYEVCKERGINFAEILSVQSTWCGAEDDLRWLVALAVWEALKSDATSSTTPQNTDS